MPKFDDSFERILWAVVTRISGRTAAALALLFYAGGGLALPQRTSSAQVQARDRRHLVEWTTNLRLLTPEEFEWLGGEAFRREGREVRETGRQDGPDGNIDLGLPGRLAKGSLAAALVDEREPVPGTIEG